MLGVAAKRWYWGLVLVFFGALVSPFQTATAAVRLCHPLVISDVSRAVKELDAKRDAMTSWKAKAVAGGLLHPSWRIANNKRFRCARVSGQFECVAVGQPCTIRQKAPKRPVRPTGPKIES